MPSSDRYWQDGDREVHVQDLSPEQGVSGCGKRGSYAYGGMGWVLNVKAEP